jgi:hypothetical protein
VYIPLQPEPKMEIPVKIGHAMGFGSPDTSASRPLRQAARVRIGSQVIAVEGLNSHHTFARGTMNLRKGGS